MQANLGRRFAIIEAIEYERIITGHRVEVKLPDPSHFVFIA
jgi:hypothetical protein